MDAVNPERADAARPNIDTLCFLRWLADRGELEHRPLSSPRGELSLRIRWQTVEGRYLVIA